MPISFPRFGSSLPFSEIFSYELLLLHRRLEQQMETVVKVLQPGPLGITEHKFSTDQANATVKRAVENWRRNASLSREIPS